MKFYTLSAKVQCLRWRISKTHCCSSALLPATIVDWTWQIRQIGLRLEVTCGQIQKSPEPFLQERFFLSVVLPPIRGCCSIALIVGPWSAMASLSSLACRSVLILTSCLWKPLLNATKLFLNASSVNKWASQPASYPWNYIIMPYEITKHRD